MTQLHLDAFLGTFGKAKNTIPTQALYTATPTSTRPCTPRALLSL